MGTADLTRDTEPQGQVSLFLEKKRKAHRSTSLQAASSLQRGRRAPCAQVVGTSRHLASRLAPWCRRLHCIHPGSRGEEDGKTDSSSSHWSDVQPQTEHKRCPVHTLSLFLRDL